MSLCSLIFLCSLVRLFLKRDPRILERWDYCVLLRRILRHQKSGNSMHFWPLKSRFGGKRHILPRMLKISSLKERWKTSVLNTLGSRPELSSTRDDPLLSSNFDQDRETVESESTVDLTDADLMEADSMQV